jgi:hypothetical protein
MGEKIYPGKPCHFIAIGKGCTVYEKRPKEPCQSYKCAWLTNSEIPEWMKPNEIDAIIDMRQIKEFEYINLREAGNPMQAKVLNWLFQYILKNGLNAVWQVNGGVNWCGSPEFNSVMELESQKDEQRDLL